MGLAAISRRPERPSPVVPAAACRPAPLASPRASRPGRGNLRRAPGMPGVTAAIGAIRARIPRPRCREYDRSRPPSPPPAAARGRRSRADEPAGRSVLREPIRGVQRPASPPQSDSRLSLSLGRHVGAWVAPLKRPMRSDAPPSSGWPPRTHGPRGLGRRSRRRRPSWCGAPENDVESPMARAGRSLRSLDRPSDVPAGANILGTPHRRSTSTWSLSAGHLGGSPSRRVSESTLHGRDDPSDDGMVAAPGLGLPRGEGGEVARSGGIRGDSGHLCPGRLRRAMGRVDECLPPHDGGTRGSAAGCA